MTNEHVWHWLFRDPRVSVPELLQCTSEGRHLPIFNAIITGKHASLTELASHNVNFMNKMSCVEHVKVGGTCPPEMTNLGERYSLSGCVSVF